MKIIQCSDVVFAINCHVLKGTTEILGMKKTLFPTYSIDNNSFAAKKKGNWATCGSKEYSTKSNKNTRRI